MKTPKKHKNFLLVLCAAAFFLSACGVGPIGKGFVYNGEKYIVTCPGHGGEYYLSTQQEVENLLRDKDLFCPACGAKHKPQKYSVRAAR